MLPKTARPKTCPLYRSRRPKKAGPEGTAPIVARVALRLRSRAKGRSVQEKKTA